MAILWAGVERYADTRKYDEMMALVLAEQREWLKARALAEKAAFDDLPPEEQRQYITCALAALKAKEFAS